jgi:hypothetical protein
MRKLLLSFLVLIAVPLLTFATAQEPDILIFKGKNHDLFSNPLEQYFKDKSKRPQFWIAPMTMKSSNWRGYVAAWEIINDQLYLSKIDSWFCEPSIKTKDSCHQVVLSELFGKNVVDNKVSANWFTGKLRVPDGKQLMYLHSGYASIYERDILFEVQEGKIISQETVDNTKKPLPSESEIYQQELERLKKLASEQRNVNSTPTLGQKTKEESEPVLIAGKGFGRVVLGAKRKDIEAALGSGEFDGSKYDDVYFIEYPKEGIQISYTNKTDEAYAIFFYNKQKYYGNFITAPIKTDKDITWSSTPEDVIKAYGKPPRDFSNDTGNSLWRRLEYDQIDFLFERGRMTRISIVRSQCTGCKK